MNDVIPIKDEKPLNELEVAVYNFVENDEISPLLKADGGAYST